MNQSEHSRREEEILKYWDENEIFKKSIEQRPEGNLYVFYDGPPFATGLPHYGHIVGSVLKDVMPRFFTMKGFRVNRTWGWDCHGLPIENIVEKKFDLGSRKEIEKFGIDIFNNKCHEEVLTYVAEWKKVIRRLGRWIDMENAYKTMDMSYMESVWWVFKSLWDKELIYEGYKPMHVCPRCETVLSNFEVNQNYVDIKDISVYVTFTITSGDYTGKKIIAWTTTPWTLPGNVLLAVKHDLKYAVVLSDGEEYIMLEKLVDQVFKNREHEIKTVITGGDLTGATYEPLFPYFADHENAFRIVSADFVTIDDGTGVVHIAPGFGDDDMKLGVAEKVEPLLHVKMNGEFVDEVKKPLLEEGYEVDRSVKVKGDNQSMDVEMIKYLAHHGKLFEKEKISHSYPHCWRCDTPLLNYATSSWFVKVTDLVDKMVRSNKEINWVPDNMKEGRFGKWLEGARDWAISRSRFWGTPLPIWKAEDGETICIGSVAELEELTGKKVDNLHKHIVDEFEIVKDGKTYKRIDEVLDCWFESGSMPYAQLHYPFENKTAFDYGFPAEFIAEGQDQTRGWFYTLHVLANALFNMPAFKNVIVNGIVLAEDGKKMAKRLKNYPDPLEMMEKYGSDAMRYYLMASPVVHAENLRFAEKGVLEVVKKFINISRNVTSFYSLYKDIDDGRDPSFTNVLDSWIWTRLNETLKQETAFLEAYKVDGACRVLQNFVTDLSTWYVRRSRDRFKVDGEDRMEAVATLRVVLEIFSKMIAPITPFLGEFIYQEVSGGFLGSNDRMSVHLEDWPDAIEVNTEVLEKMGEVRSIVSKALELREEAGRPIKQVLSSLTIDLPSGELEEAYLQVLMGEINVKEIIVNKGEKDVALDTELTPELIREGMVRDITRKVNQLRKEANLTIEDKINLKIWSESEEVRLMFEEYKNVIQETTLSSSVEFVETDTVKNSKEFRVAEQNIRVGF